jgi:hypothetical protein
MPGSKAGGAASQALRGWIFRGDFPRTSSARLTSCPKLNAVVWLLRCSVLRGTPMPEDATVHFKNLKRYGSPCF